MECVRAILFSSALKNVVIAFSAELKCNCSVTNRPVSGLFFTLLVRSNTSLRNKWHYRNGARQGRNVYENLSMLTCVNYVGKRGHSDNLASCRGAPNRNHVVKHSEGYDNPSTWQLSSTRRAVNNVLETK